MNINAYIPYSNIGFYYQMADGADTYIHSTDFGLLKDIAVLSFATNGTLSSLKDINDASDIIKLYGINKPEVYDRNKAFIRKFNKVHNKLQAYKKTFTSMGVNLNCLKIEYCIPEQLLNEFLDYRSDFLRQFAEYCKSYDLSYYDTYFKRAKYALSRLQDMAFDKDRLSYAILSNKSVEASTKNLFLRQGTNLAAPMKMNMFGTRTGRLSVTKGINILTLPKNHRGVITSKFDGGSIYLLDFDSMEIRTAACLIEAFDLVEEDDLHEYFAGIVFGDTNKRDLFKKMFFPLFYGSSSEKIADICGISLDEAQRVIKKTRKVFPYQKVIDLVKVQSLSGKSYIENCFGRPVFLDGGDESKHKLVNYFIQSSASDLALQALGSVVEYIEEEGLKSGPIYVHHDAIAFDIHPDEVDCVDNMAYIMENDNMFNVRFPVSKEVLSK